MLTLYDWSLEKHRKFVYDGYKLIAEFDALASDTQLASYLWQPTGLDVPLMRIANNTQTYYIADGNKSIIALKDSSGADVSTYAYTPFGSLENPVDGDENPFRFSSEYADDETGLVYYNYRYYSPQLGRWTKRDPIEEEGGVNLYCACGNNTINHNDRLGLARTVITLLDDKKIKLNNPTLAEFVKVLKSLCDARQKAKEIWLYGHGNHEEMYINDSHSVRTIRGIEAMEGDVAIFVHNNDIRLYEIGGKKSVSISSLLECITCPYSTIYLNGCNTARDSKWLFPTTTSISKEISDALTDVTIKGNTGYALGLYFATISDTQEYKNGNKK